MPRSKKDGTPAAPPNKRKLSSAFVATVEPRDGRALIVWDAVVHGLALQVMPTGHRSYKFIYRIRGRGPRWFAMGNANALSLVDARKLAIRLAGQVAEGKDPHADRVALRGRGSFEQLATRYVNEYAAKKNKSYRQAEVLVTRYLLPKWAKLDIGSITRADVRAAIAAIEKPVLANQVRASASAIFSWAVKQEIIAVNPCVGVERNETTSRERILSDTEIAAFWPLLTVPLKVILLTGQRPGEVANLHRSQIIDGWWCMPGLPDPTTNWPGTKNAASHRVWLPKPAVDLLPELFANAVGTKQMQADMKAICKRLGVREKVTPHDLRRTFCSKVTGLGFGRDAMDRIANHKTDKVTDVYDRANYQEEDRRIMESVARHIMMLVEGGAGNVVAFR